MRLGRLIITIDRRPYGDLSEESLRSVDAAYEAGLAAGKKLILGTLCARSGTMWLCDIFAAHQNATGITERNFEPESFYRYITYNKLPIDTSGIIALIKRGIVEDWKKGDVALVYSPFFSHGMLELNEALRPHRIMFAITTPEFTVQSMFNKGFFRHFYIRKHVDQVLGYQPAMKGSWSHLFGRIVPNGAEYERWLGLTRFGKVAWWGNRINVDIWDQLKTLPQEKIFIFDLKQADQNYDYYLKMAKEFGLTPILKKGAYLALKGKRVRAKQNAVHEWTDTERAEFLAETKEWNSLYEELSKRNPFLG